MAVGDRVWSKRSEYAKKPVEGTIKVINHDGDEYTIEFDGKSAYTHGTTKVCKYDWITYN